MNEESSESSGTISELCNEIFNYIKKIQKQYEQRERDIIKHQFRSHGISGITPPQFFVLRVLWWQDGFSLKYLAKAAHCSRSTMTGIIDTMEKDGLVFREENPDDKRIKLVFLTDKGRSLQKYQPPQNISLTDIFRNFKPEEINLLNQLLKNLSESMEE